MTSELRAALKAEKQKQILSRGGDGEERTLECSGDTMLGPPNLGNMLHQDRRFRMEIIIRRWKNGCFGRNINRFWVPM